MAVLAGLFAALVLRGMETGTISSTTPRLEDLEGAAAAPLRETGLDPFELAEAGPGEVADRTGTSPDRARDWIEEAHLLTLRGIGPENAERLRAVDVSSVAELAREEPARLAARLEAAGLGVSEARVRVWVRAAVRAVQSSS